MKARILAFAIALCVLYAPIQLSRIEKVYVAMFGWCTWGVLDMALTWSLYAIALILLWRLSKCNQ